MENVGLTVGIQTKLNRSHLHHGREALILPCLGRTERDITAAGEQFVTVEDSMSMVHSSRGKLLPGSPHLRSEIQIICGIAARPLRPRLRAGSPPRTASTGRAWHGTTRHPTPHRARRPRLPRLRGAGRAPGRLRAAQRRARLARLRDPDRQGTHHRQPADGGRRPRRAICCCRPCAPTTSSTPRVYGYDDRYRGIKHGRNVVFVNPEDLTALGLADGDMVDLVSRRRGRRAPAARSAGGRLPDARRAAPRRTTPRPTCSCRSTRVADESNTPVSKSIVVRLEHAQTSSAT